MTVNRVQEEGENTVRSDTDAELNGPAGMEVPRAAATSVDTMQTSNENSRPSTKDGSVGSPVDVERDLGRLNGSDKPTQGRTGMRSASSKIASLRATFEQGNAAPAGAEKKSPRRLASTSEKEKADGMIAEQILGYTTEIIELKDKLEKEKELRVAFEERVTSLEEEVHDLSGALNQRDEQWQEEFEKRSADLLIDAESRLDIAAKEARSRENEAVSLQRQLAELKQTVAASTRITPQVSDTTFRQEVDTLQYEMQNWVVNNFRRVKVELSTEELCERLEKVAEEKQVEQLKAIYETFEPAAKFAIYQATVACYLMEVFEDPYLFGIQSQRDWGRRSRQAADTLKTVLEEETFNRWRSLTFDSLRRSESIKEPVESAAQGIAELICIALKALSASDEAEDLQSNLVPIIKRAISVAHLLRVQYATYVYRLPGSGDTFNADLMDDIADDGASDAIRTVRCATFPSLIKYVDDASAGEHVEQVVVKAKVLCHAGKP